MTAASPTFIKIQVEDLAAAEAFYRYPRASRRATGSPRAKATTEWKETVTGMPGAQPPGRASRLAQNALVWPPSTISVCPVI